MRSTRVRIITTEKSYKSKALNKDMKNFGRRQLVALMNKNLALPFQLIQL